MENKQVYPKTKEELLRIGWEELHLNEKGIRNRLQKFRAQMPFDPEHWDHYLTIITGLPSCRVCNGPMERKRPWPYPMCKQDPTHYFAIRVAEKLARAKVQWKGKEVTFEHALAVVLGPSCEHGLTVLTCPICIEIATKQPGKFVYSAPGPEPKPSEALHPEPGHSIEPGILIPEILSNTCPQS